MRFFGWLKRDKGWTLDGEGDSEFREIEVKGEDCPHAESRRWSVEGGLQRRCRSCDWPLSEVEEVIE